LKLIDEVIKKTKNLDVYWDSGDLPSKKRVQKAIFPEGIVVKAYTKLLLTDKISTYFDEMICLSKNYKKRKSGESNKKFDFPAFVPKAGIYLTLLSMI